MPITTRDLNQPHHYTAERNWIYQAINDQAALCANLIASAKAKTLAPWLHEPERFADIQAVLLIASGSSFHAAQVARFWIESLARLPAQVELASEFCHQPLHVHTNTLVIILAESGEAPDTLAALTHAQQLAHRSIAIGHHADSTLMQRVQWPLVLDVGEQHGRIATKTFCAQLLGLFLITQTLAQSQNQPSNFDTELAALPDAIAQILNLAPQFKQWAQCLHAEAAIFITARQIYSPIASEGALKFKAIAHRFAEACPCSELKHGIEHLAKQKIALITCLPWDALTEKTLADLRQFHHHDCAIFVLSDAPLAKISGLNTIQMPDKLKHLNPLLYAIALQGLAYYTSTMRTH
ncbi:SIS domain-containing protein [Deefgea salmonis]|uniref:Glutamine--fructose-6-phosphate aminotransferase [isomerizing] n=1 Tax=Deefgea salmonis TaxID=2875502 RepID=A0ABS8BID4_9NEIS|nr:SIS domain-containing protein [Deefgea salmonis]MCB5195321.1 SIS domain-containing protein [Deefgea salmonis]